jgi:ketose-bisphosphate aldolase
MTLVPENLILENAEKFGYAVPGLFPFDMNFIKIILEAAEEEQSPIIILQGPELIRLFGTKTFSSALVTAAQNADVPVSLAIDHGIKTDERIIRDVLLGIRNGWQSVMIDGSLLSYENNIRLTKKMTDICHYAEISCCGALGEVKRFFPIFKETYDDDFRVDQELMTDPFQAKDFVSKTGVDSLAISIGQYVRSLWEEEPEQINKTARLDLERLKEIRNETSAHLILHGSSHVDEEDLRKSIDLGVSEIKFASEYGVAWAIEMKKQIDQSIGLFHPMDIQKAALLSAKNVIKDKMRLFMSSGKACLLTR